MGGSMKRAGAETMIMQYLRQLVKDDRFEFSILVHGYDKGDYDDEIATFGVPIYHVPVRGKHPLTYTHEVKKVLKTHPADIIHCNMDSACGDFLTIAKECGIEIRIAHSHLTHFQASTPIKILVAKKSKERIHEVATIRLACSEKAGKWLYEEDAFSVINNAIDLEEYTPDSGKREEMRSEFGLSQEETAIVNIGRFHYQKNHKKLLDIFASYRQQYNKGVLFLVGTGELIDQIKEYARQLNIEKNVVFLGLRKDIPNLLQAMDVFVMPSLFEGLPVSGIEAQAAGLPCFFADTITPEICMTNYAKRLPLDDIGEWVNALNQIPHKKNPTESQEALRKYGYDIKVEADQLAEFYVDAYFNRK